MNIKTENLISMSEANQNFSAVSRMVDKNGMAVILKNNKPRYVVVDFEEYEHISTALELRRAKINSTADALIEENIEAFRELAK